MNQQSVTQAVMFPELFGRPLLARFDVPQASSDGGAILLKAADRRLGLIKKLAGCLRDDRQAGKVEHELIELLAQRVFGIACGYPDANDTARLSQDPIQKMLLGRDPVEGASLASQPTLSRFENGVGSKQLYRLGETLMRTVFARQARRRRGRARRVVLDLDVTDDPTHGAQQLSFFNGYYDAWCYLPLLGFVSFDDEAEQHLFAAMLRPGNAPTKKGALGMLKRSILTIAEEFPQSRILVRLDGGFACPELFESLEMLPGVDYAVGLASNSVLQGQAEALMATARRLSEKTGQTAKVYGECWYQANSWVRPRRVIIKAEVVRLEGREPKDNPRFVVTSLRQSPRFIYEKVYCRRGEIENRIKELQLGLEIDRTSCTRFWANQFRVLMTAAAYVLMQELRAAAAATRLSRAQVWTMREKLIKIGALVAVSVRRYVLHLPESFPFAQEWLRTAGALGARTG